MTVVKMNRNKKITSDMSLTLKLMLLSKTKETSIDIKYKSSKKEKNLGSNAKKKGIMRIFTKQ